jgi:hypothetical protein
VTGDGSWVFQECKWFVSVISKEGSSVDIPAYSNSPSTSEIVEMNAAGFLINASSYPDNISRYPLKKRKYLCLLLNMVPPKG